MRALLDVDDGTPDGNTRLGADGAVVTADALGDGQLDMADFRRWRDWLLDAEGLPSPSLDGAPTHGKRDLNRSGTVDGDELLYPRGDFNGDGVLHRTRQVMLPRILSGQMLSDLDVLRQRFQDPDYQESQLAGLIDSGDLHVLAASCWPRPGVSGVRSSVRQTGTTTAIQQRSHPGINPDGTYTVPVNAAGYTWLVELLGGGNQVTDSLERDVQTSLGSDTWWDPCSVVITPNKASLNPGDTLTLTATVAGESSNAVTWTTTAGTITSGGKLTVGTATGRFRVTATSVANKNKIGMVWVTVGGGRTERFRCGSKVRVLRFRFCAIPSSPHENARSPFQ